MVEQSLMPMKPEDCLTMLGELKLKTGSRSLTQDEIQGQIIVYMKELQAFSADAVRQVLKTQAQESEWWPTWKQLNDRLVEYSGTRRALLRCLNAPAQALPPVEQPRVTPAQLDEILRPWKSKRQDENAT